MKTVVNVLHNLHDSAAESDLFLPLLLIVVFVTAGTTVVIYGGR